MSEGNEKMVRVDVGGVDETLWTKLRAKLIAAITNLLDTELDPLTKTTLGQEAEQFTHALLEYAKAKLNKPAIDNDKTIAEIEELYSRKQRNLAETRKIHAEAEALELQTRIKRLKVALKAAKAFLHGNPGQEEILFIKNVDKFLLAMSDMDQDRQSLVE